MQNLWWWSSQDLYLFGFWGDGPVCLKASKQWDDYANADADADNECGKTNPPIQSMTIWHKPNYDDVCYLFRSSKLFSDRFHDSSMIQVLRSWTAANVEHYRLDRAEKYDEPTFSVFLNVGSIIAAPPVIRMSLKYIWFRVSSRNHMQRAARLSQQLCLPCWATSSSTNARCLLL